MKEVIKKIIYGKKYNSQSYKNHLRSIGMKVGSGTEFYGVKNIMIDETRPWLIDIGENCNITDGVRILTHGYDLAVLLNYYGELYGSSGKVRIGDNVFIGMNSTILKGVTIGNNVIIEANSLVNKNIPNNVVIAGNPARVIMTLDEYREKRKSEYVDEAMELAREYKNTYGKNPKIEVFHEYFPIMLERENINEVNFGFLKNKKFSEKFINSKPVYNGLGEFLKACDNSKEKIE